MNSYTIFCTEEQTKKALELGAQIETQEYCPIGGLDDDWFAKGRLCFHKPTAEQMIGWLEEKYIEFNIAYNPFSEVKVIITECGIYNEIANIKWTKSRKEATLAAIDAALEYLKSKS